MNQSSKIFLLIVGIIVAGVAVIYIAIALAGRNKAEVNIPPQPFGGGTNQEMGR